MADRSPRPAPGTGLSARLLALTVAFVFLGEILIFMPSIARYRLTFLEERIARAHLATLTVPPGPKRLDMDVEDALLVHAGVLSVTLWHPEPTVMLGQIAPVDAVFDLRRQSPLRLMRDSLVTLWREGRRNIRVIGPSPQDPGVVVDIVLAEAPLWVAMIDYTWRILGLSIVLSIIVAALLFLSIRRMLLRPLERISRQLLTFRERPADIGADPPPSRRRDEIGIVERELALMRRQIRRALAQQTRLAMLGAAVARISHDLRNMLATAVLLSDRLESSADPAVREIAPRLVAALDRGARLCKATLDFSRTEPGVLALAPVALRPLLEEVRASLPARNPDLVVELDVAPGLSVRADRDQLYRALMNVLRNAAEAIGPAPGRITASASVADDRVRLDIADTGPGIPPAVRGHLFEAFGGSGKAEGSGLGLAIAHEILAAHGGEIALLKSDAAGTSFRIVLARSAPPRRAGRREMSMLRGMSLGLVGAFGLAVAGCGSLASGPSVAGYEGLQFQITSYYRNHAWEENASCVRPEMQISRARVIEDTPERVVMDITYHYYDESVRDSDDWLGRGFGTGAGTCNDFSERTFVIGKTTGGGTFVQSMTGPQRPPPG